MGARAAGRVASPVVEPGHPTPAVVRRGWDGEALARSSGGVDAARRGGLMLRRGGGARRRPIGGREGEMRDGRDCAS